MEGPQQLFVLAIGTRVRLGLRDDNDALDGRITEISIYADYSVSYTVEWWDGRKRYLASMVGDLLFPAADVEPVAVGFLALHEGNSG